MQKLLCYANTNPNIVLPGIFSLLTTLKLGNATHQGYSLDQHLNLLWFNTDASAVDILGNQLQLLDQPNHNLWVHVYILSNIKSNQNAHQQSVKLQLSPRTTRASVEGLNLKLNRHNGQWQSVKDVALNFNFNHTKTHQDWFLDHHYKMLVLNHEASVLNIPAPPELVRLATPPNVGRPKAMPHIGLHCQVDAITKNQYELQLSLQQTFKNKKKRGLRPTKSTG